MSNNKYDAILFDLDGVICSTDEYHYLAWKTIADELGLPFSREKGNRTRGVSRMESLAVVIEDYDKPLTEEEKVELATTKNTRYQKLLEQMSPADLDPQVYNTLVALRERGIKLAIGSSSKNAKLILGRLGLGDFFDAIADGTDITRSKPDPEVFLCAAAKVNTPPERCLVVEDAVAGAQAGHGAGSDVACVGDAAANKAGDYNLTSFAELLDCV